jgi:hypothetical protein
MSVIASGAVSVRRRVPVGMGIAMLRYRLVHHAPEPASISVWLPGGAR